MNVISPAERVGTQGPALGRHAARGRRGHDRVPVQRRRRRRARARRARRRRRRDHPRADPAQHRRGAAAARVPRAAARARDEARHGARLRRGDHRLPPRARRLPGGRRRHARPDDARQGDGERLARLGARRQGGADGPLLDHARAARLLRRHVQRPPGHDRGRARDDREARARAGARARLPARRASPHRPARSSTTRLGVPAVVVGLRLGLRDATSSTAPSSATTTSSATTSTCSSATGAS